MEESQQQRDYKTRNILTMAQRIKVIKAYKHTPNYQRLGRIFGCSAKQIKNIINNKNELLHYYKNVRANKLADEVANRRQEKINFLGKVVYEFLLRALYLRIPVGTTIIRQKAFEVKEAIAIENFSPNQAWLEDFKSTYNRLDLENMMEHLPDDMNKRRSLKCIDLIEYVSWQERDENKKEMSEDENCNSVWENEYCSYDTKQFTTKEHIEETYDRDDYDDVYVDNFTIVSNASIRECVGEKNMNPCDVVIKIDSDGDDNDEVSDSSSLVKTATRNACPNNGRNSSGSSAITPPLPDIHSYLEALRHLKVLEDFAMIEENYRAIGLLTQLEQIFKNPPKLKRITT